MATDEEYVTRYELIKAQHDLRKDVTDKIEDVDGKVDNVYKMVLPLVESSKQTAINTEKMAKSLDKFTEEQRKTNGKVYDRLHDHDLSLNKLGQETRSQVEIKKANATITVAVITAIAGLIVALFNLAPLLFN